MAPARDGAGDHAGRTPRARCTRRSLAPAISAWSSVRRRTRPPGRSWPVARVGRPPRVRSRRRSPAADPELVERPAARRSTDRVSHGLELAGGVGIRVRALGARTARRPARASVSCSARRWTCCRVWPARHVRPTTRISLGLLIDEQARARLNRTCFLFEDRAYSQAAVNGRIDNVVRGLIETGVRQGERVGVLMGPRPSGWSAGLGAEPARRGGRADASRRRDRPRSAELGEVSRCRRSRAGSAGARPRPACGATCSAAAPGARPRARPDRHGADRSDQVRAARLVPARSRPGRDLAFVLFTGRLGERLRASRITNRRWAMSAFGTASAAALTESDTVYSLTPIHHASGMLMSVGGAVAGGARIALASLRSRDRSGTRCAATASPWSSTPGTMLRDLVDAPSYLGEHHHPIRMFIGSGMPPRSGGASRALRPASGARVLRLHRGRAVLVNVAGTKPGSMGRAAAGQLRGARIASNSPEQRAAWSKSPTVRCAPALPVRSGCCSRRSARTWSPPAPIPCAGSSSPTTPGRDRRPLPRGRGRRASPLSRQRGAADPHGGGDGSAPGRSRRAQHIDCIDLAVAYGTPVHDGEHELALAAVTLRGDRELEATS